jgi:hypothetical protein
MSVDRDRVERSGNDNSGRRMVYDHLYVYESINGNHNSVHFIGQEKEIPDGTEVVPKISLWSAVLNINSGNLINYCPT